MAAEVQKGMQFQYSLTLGIVLFIVIGIGVAVNTTNIDGGNIVTGTVNATKVFVQTLQTNDSISVTNQTISNVSQPEHPSDVATKAYVDKIKKNLSQEKETIFEGLNLTFQACADQHNPPANAEKGAIYARAEADLQMDVFVGWDYDPWDHENEREYAYISEGCETEWVKQGADYGESCRAEIDRSDIEDAVENRDYIDNPINPESVEAEPQELEVEVEPPFSFSNEIRPDYSTAYVWDYFYEDHYGDDYTVFNHEWEQEADLDLSTQKLVDVEGGDIDRSCGQHCDDSSGDVSVRLCKVKS